ncbi:hypothetical protein [Streptomyces longisporoflavus]|uniref:Uncharacterized protein n=1 Tax=Streptomyces longisporoflavus TaxID=28044 RepID=A0ABW7R3E4_9ACTN
MRAGPVGDLWCGAAGVSGGGGAVDPVLDRIPPARLRSTARTRPTRLTALLADRPTTAATELADRLHALPPAIDAHGQALTG